MFEEKRKNLVQKLISEGYIRSEPVKKAFLTVAREHFIPKHLQQHAYDDTPLSIGYGQTISAPHMVALMCEALEVYPGQKILEIGTGSGYHAAIVASVVGERGQVYSVERIDELAQQAKKKLMHHGFSTVSVETGDGSLGLEAYQPYDCIYVTCASPSIPQPLIDQLKDPGKLLIPVGDVYCELVLLEKKKNSVTQKDLGGCVFVPLIGQYGHQRYSL